MAGYSLIYYFVTTKKKNRKAECFCTFSLFMSRAWLLTFDLGTVGKSEDVWRCTLFQAWQEQKCTEDDLSGYPERERKSSFGVSRRKRRGMKDRQGMRRERKTGGGEGMEGKVEYCLVGLSFVLSSSSYWEQRVFSSENHICNFSFHFLVATLNKVRENRWNSF